MAHAHTADHQVTLIPVEASKGNAYKVVGQLRFSNVTQLLKNSNDLFNGGDAQICIDLSEVTHSDSAGLALLTEWMRRAKKQRQDIVFLNVPRQMLEIARASGLDDLLPLKRG